MLALEPERSETIEEYLSRKHAILTPDYTNEAGFTENCLGIALEAARLLVRAGGRPSVVLFEKRDHSHGYFVASPMNVGWSNHKALRLDNVIYDPVVGYPIDEDAYRTFMFQNGDEIVACEALSADEVESVLMLMRKIVE